MQKEAVSIRIDPQYHSLLKRIAKEEYGKDSKKGYVVENALQLYQAHRTNPMEAAGILSVAEEKLIDRLDKRFNDVGKNMVERIGNLVAKSGYENTLQSVLLQEVFFKAGFNKTDYERKRKEAAYRMKGRLENESLDDLAGILEENEHLKQANEKIEGRLQEAAKAFRQLEEKQRILESENQNLSAVKEKQEQKYKQLQTWANGLANYLAQKGGPLKKNSTLIEEYTRANPAPGDN